MARELTKKQKDFADNYIESGNRTNAVIKAGYKVKNNHSARSIGSENLTKLDIRAYIQEQAGGAMSRIVEMSIKAKNEAVKLNANKDIVDRAGYKPPEKFEHTGRITVDKSKDEALNKLMEVLDDNQTKYPVPKEPDGK